MLVHRTHDCASKRLREELVMMIRRMPDEELLEARQLLRELLESREDYEDEELSPVELAGMAEADVREGRLKFGNSKG